MNNRIVLTLCLVTSFSVASGPTNHSLTEDKATAPAQPESTLSKISRTEFQLKNIDKEWSDTILDQEATYKDVEKLLGQLADTLAKAQNRLAMRDGAPVSGTPISTQDLQAKDKACREHGTQLAARVAEFGAQVACASDERPVVKLQAGNDKTRSNNPVSDQPLATNLGQANELYAKRVKKLEKERHDACVSLAKELIKEHGTASRIKLWLINRWA